MKNRTIASSKRLLKHFYLKHWQWIWTTAIGLSVAAMTLWVRFEFLWMIKQGS